MQIFKRQTYRLMTDITDVWSLMNNKQFVYSDLHQSSKLLLKSDNGNGNLGSP